MSLEGAKELLEEGGREVVLELLDFAHEQARVLLSQPNVDLAHVLADHPALTALQQEALRQRLMRHAWYARDARTEKERQERGQRAAEIALTVLRFALGAAGAALL